MAALVTDDVVEAGIAKAMAQLQTEDEPGDWIRAWTPRNQKGLGAPRWAPGYYERVEAGSRSTCVKPSALHGAGLFATRAFGGRRRPERKAAGRDADLSNKREVVACATASSLLIWGGICCASSRTRTTGGGAHDAVSGAARGPEGVCARHAQCGELSLLH